MVEYSFYTDTYHGGSIPADEWSRYEADAEAQLTRYKRTYTVTAPDEDSESMAVCAMADAFFYIASALNGTGGAISSASIGSVSESYGASAAVDLSPAGQAKQVFAAASLYLDIYRGVRQCWR